MKKICFVCPWMHVNGGLQRVITSLANYLSTYYDVSICIISISKKPPYYKLVESIKVYYLEEAAFGNADIIRKILAKIVNKIGLTFNEKLLKWVYYYKKRITPLENFIAKNNFDVVISSSGDLNLLLACINKNHIKTKLIGWQHNSYEDYFRRKGYYYYGREKIANQLYRNLNYLVTLTKADATKYKNNMGIDAISIYNPLSFVELVGSNVKNNNLLFVGRLDWEQKGLSYFSKIVSQILSSNEFNDWKMTVVGDGKGKEQLIQQLDAYEVMDKVSFVGEKQDVRPYYREASILLNTSQWEGFGMVITEAFECGVPVISFKTDGPSEIIEDNINGFLIEKYDVKKYVQKTEELMRNLSLRELFSIEAKKRASFFNIELIGSQWRKLIEDGM